LVDVDIAVDRASLGMVAQRGGFVVNDAVSGHCPVHKPPNSTESPIGQGYRMSQTRLSYLQNVINSYWRELRAKLANAAGRTPGKLRRTSMRRAA
jgi:hypothetical protein